MHNNNSNSQLKIFVCIIIILPTGYICIRMLSNVNLINIHLVWLTSKLCGYIVYILELRKAGLELYGKNPSVPYLSVIIMLLQHTTGML